MSDDTPTPDAEAPEVEAPETTEETAGEETPDAALTAKREAANAKREATKLRKELEALRTAEEERKLSEMGELERAQAKAEALERELHAIREQAERTQREGWIRDAARDARMDPDVAVALLYGQEVEAGADAASLVKALAEEKPHLVTPEKGDTPRVGVPTSPAPAASDDDPEKTLSNFLLGVIGRRS